MPAGESNPPPENGEREFAVPLELNSLMLVAKKFDTQTFPETSMAMAYGTSSPPVVMPVDPVMGDPPELNSLMLLLVL